MQSKKTSAHRIFRLTLTIVIFLGTMAAMTVNAFAAADLAYNSLIVANGSDESELMFTWYTAEPTGKIAYREAGGEDFTMVDAYENTQRGAEYIHKASIDGLEADTDYEYQLVGESESTSELFEITTGNPDDFSFFFMGDPQIGSSGNRTQDTDGWGNTLDRATAAFPDADFIMSAGDQVETNSNTNEYAGYLSPDQMKTLPSAQSVGNHDSNNQLFNDHYSFPNAVSVGSRGTDIDYWYTYGDALFMHINGNVRGTNGVVDDAEASHRSFMEDAIAQNPDAVWKVVVFHQAPYSNASHYDNDGYGMRETWTPMFDDLGVDVVLNGHDHSYNRSHQMLGNNAVKDQQWIDEDGNVFAYDAADEANIASGEYAAKYSKVLNPTGTAYIATNSASGSKFYNLNNRVGLQTEFTALFNMNNRANFSVINVTEDEFVIETYELDGRFDGDEHTLIDSYTIVKDADASDSDMNVTADKSTVHAGDEFRVEVSFDEEKNSNAAVLTYTFDPDKFEYKSFTSASADVQKILVDREKASEGIITVTLAVPSYNTKDYGKALFAVLEDAELGEDDAIEVKVDYVVKDAEGNKSVETASGSTDLSTRPGIPGDTDDNGVIDLIDLSNIIDAFGMTEEDPDWDDYKEFDFNNKDGIDISDIAKIAEMIA